MRVYRCLHGGAFVPGETLRLSGEESRHLVQVRRVKPGSEVLVMDGLGHVASGELLAGDARSAAVAVRSVESLPRPPRLGLALALTRGAAYDDTLVRAAELGATDFHPLVAERSVTQLDERRSHRRLERWRKLALEAVKQCERPWAMTVHEPAGLASLLGDNGYRPLALVERSGGSSLLEVVSPDPEAPWLGLVGPEGGWTEAEKALLQSNGSFAHFGRAVLRSETAALGMLSVVLACRGNVGAGA